jgi:hypothetical protein
MYLRKFTTAVLAVAVTSIVMGCGGGGSSSGASQPGPAAGDTPPPSTGSGQPPPPNGGTQPPPNGGTQPPPAPSVPTAALPLNVGKRWNYTVNSKSSVVIGGVSQTNVDNLRLLSVNRATTWQGRDAWALTQVDRPRDLTKARTAASVNLSTVYLAQDDDGLLKWMDASPNGRWTQVLSAKSATFTGEFFMAGGPSQGNGLDVSGPIPVTVPAGTFNAVEVSHDAKVTGQYATADIFESRSEYYADGVGLVSSKWSYSYDDNDPQGTDTSTTGTIDLTAADSGAAIVKESEPNDAGTTGGAQAINIGDVLTGQTRDTDPGQTVTDSNVGVNKNNVRLLQDWYAFQASTASPHLIVLKYTNKSTDTAQPDDLDLYLFKAQADGSLGYVQRSVLDPTKPESKDGEFIYTANLPGGTYYIAVQAWATPGGPVDYTLSLQ